MNDVLVISQRVHDQIAGVRKVEWQVADALTERYHMTALIYGHIYAQVKLNQ